jgi:hypothetical protein
MASKVTNKPRIEIEVFRNQGGGISISVSESEWWPTYAGGEKERWEKHESIVSIPDEMARDVAARILDVLENE